MGRQIIKQPNGKYAIWSTVSDSVIAWDGTKEEIINYFAEEAKQRAITKVNELIDQIDNGQNPYFQFAISWKECEKSIKEQELKGS